jgi:NADH-quinone oxidoreductase subunit M
MVNHGLSTGALFLLVGMIYERRHTRQIAELKGLQKVAPIFAAGFMVVMLSSDRRARPQRLRRRVPDPHRLVPHRPLVGGRGRDRRDPRRALPAVGLPAGVPRRARRGNRSFPELRAKEAAVLLPFIGLIVFTGVFPKPMLSWCVPHRRLPAP